MKNFLLDLIVVVPSFASAVIAAPAKNEIVKDTLREVVLTSWEHSLY